MRRPVLIVLAAACWMAGGAAPAQAADPHAPRGAPDHWLPNTDWVNLRWLPYDEARLYRVLGMDRGDVFRWVRVDAGNTIAELGRRRGIRVDTLARKLVAPRRGKVSARAYRALLRNARDTLTQAHLGQHILFHDLHQTEVGDRAAAIFGVRRKEDFFNLRRAELSPLQIGQLRGRSRVEMLRAATRALRDAAARGVRRGQTTRAQSDVQLDRQLRQLPRWLGQNRYNGPTGGSNMPDLPPGDVAKRPSISADGTGVTWDAYRTRVRSAERLGEIHVQGGTLHPLVCRLVGGRRRALSPANRPGSRRPHSAYNSILSGDGSAVAFETAATTFPLAKRVGQMSVLVRDVRSGSVTNVSNASKPEGVRTRSAFNPSISADGAIVVFEATDTGRAGAPSTNAVWLYDRRARRGRKLIDAEPGAAAYLPRVSGDGDLVTYTAPSTGGRTLVWAHRISTGRTSLVSRGDGPDGAAADSDAYEPSPSSDGSLVAFTSYARNLGSRTRGSRVYVRDLVRGRTTVVAGGRPATASAPALSADGRYVAFVERLKPTSLTIHGLRSRIVRVELRSGRAEVVSRRTGARGAQGGGYASEPAISADGSRVAFTSTGGNLARAKPAGLAGVFVRDLRTGRTSLLSVRGWKHGTNGAQRPLLTGDHDEA